MNSEGHTIDERSLEQLEDRLKRGIPKWEQAHFIEQVVPILVAKLRDYIESEIEGEKANETEQFLRLRHFR
jgi:hypothetical protein